MTGAKKEEISTANDGMAELASWCIAELDRKKRLLAWLESGKMKLSRSEGTHDMVDVTPGTGFIIPAKSRRESFGGSVPRVPHSTS